MQLGNTFQHSRSIPELEGQINKSRFVRSIEGDGDHQQSYDVRTRSFRTSWVIEKLQKTASTRKARILVISSGTVLSSKTYETDWVSCILAKGCTYNTGLLAMTLKKIRPISFEIYTAISCSKAYKFGWELGTFPTDLQYLMCRQYDGPGKACVPGCLPLQNLHCVPVGWSP